MSSACFRSQRLRTAGVARSVMASGRLSRSPPTKECSARCARPATLKCCRNQWYLRRRGRRPGSGQQANCVPRIYFLTPSFFTPRTGTEVHPL